MKQKKTEQITDPGRCMLCGEVFAKRSMGRHLRSCRLGAGRDKSRGKRRTALHLRVEGKYLPQYWLHIAIPIDFRLYDLDRFLRDIWLECCGHLSMFHIKGVDYTENFEEFDYAQSIDRTIPGVLALRSSFEYEYDFGTTTWLSLKALELTSVRKMEIVVLARNEPPFIPCGVCGMQAELICGMCSHLDEGWLCSPCAEKHRCENPVFLPVVNSPRTGRCGYTGPLQ